jgi:hypothetical protein
MVLRVVLTLAVVFLIAIDRMTPSTAALSRIHPVLIIIIRVEYPIPFQWSDSQDVAWLVLLAAWRLNLWTANIATVPRETLTGVFNVPQVGCLRSVIISLIAEGTEVVPCPIVHFVLGFIKHLSHI